MVKVSPSVLAADFAHLAEQVSLVERAGADSLHFDVMDGHFVPNLSMGPALVASVRRVTRLPFVVHLMVEKPLDFIEPFAQGLQRNDAIVFHIEVAGRNWEKLVEEIRAKFLKPGVALNPKTPAKKVFPLLKAVDLVTVMSVEPGFAGQSFIDVTPKIRELRKAVDASKRGIELEVDGGINAETGRRCVGAGATTLVAASFFFRAADVEKAVQELKRL